MYAILTVQSEFTTTMAVSRLKTLITLIMTSLAAVERLP